jgi:Tfp pilus assembly protein PilF
MDDAGAWLALGRAKLGLGKVKEAAVALRNAVSRDESHVTAWYWLAVAYHSMGYPGEFLDASNRIQKLDRERGEELSRWTGTKTTP